MKVPNVKYSYCQNCIPVHRFNKTGTTNVSWSVMQIKNYAHYTALEVSDLTLYIYIKINVVDTLYM